MTRDEGLLISLQKEPHNWVAVLDASHIAPNGDKYYQYKHLPTKISLNVMVDSEDAYAKISLSEEKQHPYFGNSTDVSTLSIEDPIVTTLQYIKQLTEFEVQTGTSFNFLSHVERLTQ